MENEFQSTLPLREVTNEAWDENVALTFQSTLPLREVTQSAAPCWTERPFQSTLPLREVTIRIGFNCFKHLFQSTLPLREVTNRRPCQRRRQKNFNPHSHTGSDKTTQIYCYISKKFQSTLPHGEWPITVIPSSLWYLFQSTLPHGEWHTSKQKSWWEFDFNPHSHTGSDPLSVYLM